MSPVAHQAVGKDAVCSCLYRTVSPDWFPPQMSVTIQASSQTKEAPVEESFLRELIQQGAAQLHDKKEFITSITTQLSIKSSKYKFLVEVISVTAPDAIDATFTISSSIGALWDGERDGYYTFKVAAHHVYLVTVYWIYVD